jgi:hypothetical protein
MFNKEVVGGLILNAYYADLAFKASQGIHPIQVKKEVEAFQNAVLEQVLSNWQHILDVLNDKYPDKYPPEL